MRHFDPRFKGSWNLHKTLPTGMDFFVLLASQTSLLGAHGQSNYASANTYRDELARCRIKSGEKVVSISLGAVTSVVYLVDKTEIRVITRRYGIEDVNEKDLLKLLEYYCDPSLPLQTTSDAQLVTPQHNSRDYLIITFRRSTGTNNPSCGSSLVSHRFPKWDQRTYPRFTRSTSEIRSRPLTTTTFGYLIVTGAFPHFAASFWLFPGTVPISELEPRIE